MEDTPKFLRKKDEKYPYIFTEKLAARPDMVPCDKDGNFVNIDGWNKPSTDVLARL